MPDTIVSLSGAHAGYFPARVATATVTAVIGDQVEIVIEGRHSLARSAIPALYRPGAGDIVLVMEGECAAFVIGVLQSNGPHIVSVPHDLLLSAPNGRIVLDAKSIHASAAEVTVDADRLRLCARELREIFGSVRRIVHGLLDIDAEKVCLRVKHLFALTAQRVRATAHDDVRIGGERIHLG